MDDALLVRRRQPARYLNCVLENLADGQRSAADTLAERLPVEEFGNDVRRALMRADVVDREDVGMIERRGGARLLFEPRQAIRIG